MFEKDADEKWRNKATEWIRSQGWSEENLPSDEYVQMCDAYVAGAKENGIIWHDLRINPDDLPKYKNANRSPLVITNKGIGHYNFIKKTWYVYNEECNCSFFDTVIAWCEIPKFEVEE